MLVLISLSAAVMAGCGVGKRHSSGAGWAEKETEEETIDVGESSQGRESQALGEVHETGSPGAPIALPRHYDAREHGRAAPVRDQGELGTCWAFASLSALESHLLPEESWNFSEDHMSNNPDFLLGQTGGGEYTMAMAYLLSGQGPVTEDQDPYGDGFSPEGLKPVKTVQEIRILPEGDLDAIKRSVLRWGGVQSSLFIDMKDSASISKYYQPETYAYCCPETTAPNHDVVIVGWDDDFPKEAFSENVSGNGAFLCENSWGTQFGEAGFFYVSYDDGNLGRNNVVYSAVGEPDCYDNLYQSDRCGWIGQLGYGGPTAWAAGVYAARGEENLISVGFYAIDQDTDYEVYIVRALPDKPEQKDFAKRHKMASGHLEYAGFYTIPLAKAVEVEQGERFAVMIRLTTPKAIHPIAVEFDAGDGKCRIDIQDGEGYISADGEYWEHVEEKQNCNLCLKAYTRVR